MRWSNFHANLPWRGHISETERIFNLSLELQAVKQDAAGEYCPKTKKPRVIVDTFPIAKPFETVWTAVIETFSDMNLAVVNMEKAFGFMATDWIEDWKNINGKQELRKCGSSGYFEAEFFKALTEKIK